MLSKSFPGCCTAKVLVGFGQTDTAEYRIRPDIELTVEQLKSIIGRRLNDFAIEGKAVVTCITNDQQTNANQALTECGFESSGWMSKEAHPETKLKLWWFPLNEKQING